MKRLLIFLFLASLAVVLLIQFDYVRLSNSPNAVMGLEFSLSQRQPTLTQIMDPIYESVLGSRADRRSVLMAAPTVDTLEQSLAHAKPSEATQSAKRVCATMQSAIAYARTLKERQERSAVAPSSPLDQGDPQKTSRFFLETLDRDWRTKFPEFQASAAKEWARLQSLEQAGDRPSIDGSPFAVSKPQPQ